ncbi:MAG: hypothetical protein WCT19_04470 [Candidatus Paceibacterota bacterium]
MFTKVFEKFFTPTDSVLFILRQIVSQENKKVQRPMSIKDQVFFIFANRMIIDAESALLLLKKGYYGSAYSLIAIMLRNEAMFASLISDEARLTAFWNEEKDTYQTDRGFYDSFKESCVRKVAQKEFGADAFHKSDLEKLLHGSCYAIRKAYSQKKFGEDGKSYPLIRMGKFFDKNNKRNADLLVRGALLDFLGIIFTDQQKSSKAAYKREYAYYDAVIAKTQSDIAKEERRLTRVSNEQKIIH